MNVRALFIVFTLLFIAPSVFGVELKGSIYDENLDVTKNVLVTINTTPEQRILATQGSYSFNLQEGTYSLNAEYASQGRNYSIEEIITITQEGTFVYDLFLIPGLDEDLFYNEFDDLPEPPVVDNTETAQNGLKAILFRLVGVAALLLFIYLIWKFSRKSVEEFDELSLRILRELKNNDNRMTQKELRMRFSESEATISLALSDLESQGKITKIKKGRTNIIKIQ